MTPRALLQVMIIPVGASPSLEGSGVRANLRLILRLSEGGTWKKEVGRGFASWEMGEINFGNK